MTADASRPETLYLIDAYGQIFRSFFAIRNEMRSPVTDEPTQAVFGMTAYLIKLLTKFKPDYVVAVIDAPGPTFRDAIHTEYKGTRQSIPHELIQQIPRVIELFDAFGIMRIQESGLEADDLIAAVTKKVLDTPEHAKVRIRIASKDKDMLQLICDRVTLFDIQTEMETDAVTLFAAKGIRPDQVIDYLTLIGDTVDNVPGFAGIGPKTAAELLQQCGSLAGIYDKIGTFPARRQAQLEDGRVQSKMSQTLVKLCCDCSLSLELESMRPRGINLPAAISLFQELGFKRFQNEVRLLPQFEDE